MLKSRTALAFDVIRPQTTTLADMSQKPMYKNKSVV